MSRARWFPQREALLALFFSALIIGLPGTAQASAGDVLAVANSAISVNLNTATGAVDVMDLRTSQVWHQEPLQSLEIRRVAMEGDSVIMMVLFQRQLGLEIDAKLELQKDAPEFTITLSADGNLPVSLAFPFPFVTDEGTYLVVPLNEGISYPVEDMSIAPMRLVAYAGGYGLSMAFWGVTDGEKGYMSIIETPDDAAIRIRRFAGKLIVAPEWDSQKGNFGYPRRLRYVFFDNGGYVAMCKRYRQYAQQIGLFKTLDQKLTSNPNVDLLIGAVDIWSGEDPRVIVPEMRSLGMEFILWSSWSQQVPPDAFKAMNQIGVLTSSYDIYQDVMNPENLQFLDWINPRWITEAWPSDMVIGPDGQWVKGYQVQGKDGSSYSAGVLSDGQAIKHAMKRIPPELSIRPYRARFIDTVTASPWREDYSPDHPLTRTESRNWRMQLLRYVSEDLGLVTGSENGNDAAVPYLHYFEGMMSLVPYRVPDAGRNVKQVWNQVPDNVARFQVGHQYRLPLWELVYHDAAVSYWFWGDYSNKLPALWDKKDLFNVLYGTPPMFVLDREIWQNNKQRFLRSYSDVSPIARAVGYAEMTLHRFLKSDRSVQESVFSNGVKVVVNFGEAPYACDDGTVVPPMEFRVFTGALQVTSTD